jgi:shikimate dehydrogenase
MPNPDKPHTLAQLEYWDRGEPSLAVLGHPVGHSVSPQMHNAALDYLRAQSPEMAKKLFGWMYYKFDIEDLDGVFELLQKKNFKGVNVTVPHKGHAAALCENCGLDAANTVVFAGNGTPKAFNTDGYGMIQSLKRDLGVDLAAKTVVLLGAGGAASGVAGECIRHGCKALWIGNRDGKRQAKLIAELGEYLKETSTPGLPIPEVRGFDISSPDPSKWPADVVVINATTLGMKPDDRLPLVVRYLGELGKQASVFDMVYNREGTTKFVEAARAQGLRATDGLSMLVWQGAASLCIWLKEHLQLGTKPADVAQVMMDAACDALGHARRSISPHA